MSSKVIGLITGHGHLRKHLHRVGILQEDPLCRRCNEQEETAEHLLFDCPAIARERYAIFGSLDRGVSARLTNMYVSWQTRPVAGEPFTVDATIIYAESTVRYTPSRWQQLRLGWVQFFPILVISILAFRAVKSFIFSNQLVHTYRDIPWKPLR
ncbi:hypothetical protein J6590_092077 [Homalodisca vitripennis]|nr:hypothetical protein J6590_092077 [Homalodisca vitripennis]